MHRNTRLVVSMLALALCAGSAMAQTLPPPPDSLKVDYFAYANTAGAPDATLRLTNPGTTGSNMCAAIYVFEPDQEMSECCSCLLSPNGLRTLSVNTDVTGNPVTGAILKTGSISIVSTPTVDGQCAPSAVLTPTAGGVRAWATHIDRRSKADFSIGGATASQDATLSSAEQNDLAETCYFIESLGSGLGMCTCGTGD
jgi:hypothetical protein